MKVPSHMPTFGCEHINQKALDKIKAVRVSRENWLEDFVQYTCLSCEFCGSFFKLNEHFKESQHNFAINSRDVYCGECRDIVYDPSIMNTNSRKRKSPELSKEDEDYISANTMPKPCGREGVRGLFNLGETCYMNSVLQMMIHNSMLAHYFLGMGHPIHSCPISKEPDKKNDSDDSDDELGEEREQKTCVACAMTELFSDAYSVDQPVPAHAVNLLFASWKHIPSMSGKGQQDAQEWFTIIIDKLHDATINPAQNPSFKPSKAQCECFFHKIFYGQFYETITCDVCDDSKSGNSEYSSIDLDFQKQKKRKKKLLKEAAAAANPQKGDEPKGKKAQALAQQSLQPIPTLSECLKAYTTSEALTAEYQQIDCRTCKKKTTAHKRTQVEKLPTILTMHVKRFGMKKPPGFTNGTSGAFASMMGTPEKYEGKLDFPLALDMAPYCMLQENPEETLSNAPRHPGDNYRPKYMYDLDCVVVHQGDHSHTGHYYAFCRVAMGDGKTMKWFKFDDEIVSATTVEEVLRQEAYLLFYGLRNVPKMCVLEENGVYANGKANGSAN